MVLSSGVWFGMVKQGTVWQGFRFGFRQRSQSNICGIVWYGVVWSSSVELGIVRFCKVLLGFGQTKPTQYMRFGLVRLGLVWLCLVM